MAMTSLLSCYTEHPTVLYRKYVKRKILWPISRCRPNHLLKKIPKQKNRNKAKPAEKSHYITLSNAINCNRQQTITHDDIK
jgi:hypothetical protein